MTRRDKLAGWQHAVEFTVALVGILGWLWFVTHRPREYQTCDCKKADRAPHNTAPACPQDPQVRYR